VPFKLCCAIVLAIVLTIAPATVQIISTPPVRTKLEVCKIPPEYYNQLCQKPAHLTFYDWMTTLQMPPYETDAFDCSQMSAYVEWLSENCGHRATIAGKAFEDFGHIWVLISIANVPFAYETTWPPNTNPWLFPRSDWHFSPDVEWESLYQAPCDHLRFEQEYAWWITYPSLVTTVWR